MVPFNLAARRVYEDGEEEEENDTVLSDMEEEENINSDEEEEDGGLIEDEIEEDDEEFLYGYSDCDKERDDEERNNRLKISSERRKEKGKQVNSNGVEGITEDDSDYELEEDEEIYKRLMKRKEREEGGVAYDDVSASNVVMLEKDASYRAKTETEILLLFNSLTENELTLHPQSYEKAAASVAVNSPTKDRVSLGSSASQNSTKEKATAARNSAQSAEKERRNSGGEKLAPAVLQVLAEVSHGRSLVGRFGFSANRKKVSLNCSSVNKKEGTVDRSALETNKSNRNYDHSATTRGRAEKCFSSSFNKVYLTKDTLQSLRDINILLRRERGAGGFIDTLDEHYLSQHPRFATMYIFRNNLLQKHVLTTWRILADEKYEISFEEKQNILIEIMKMITMLSKTPPKEWLTYWSENQPNYKKKINLPEVQTDSKVAVCESRKRGGIVQEYLLYLQNLKLCVSDPPLWKLLNDYYIYLHDYLDNGCMIDSERKQYEEWVMERKRLVEGECDNEVERNLYSSDENNDEKKKFLKNSKKASSERAFKLLQLIKNEDKRVVKELRKIELILEMYKEMLFQLLSLRSLVPNEGVYVHAKLLKSVLGHKDDQSDCLLRGVIYELHKFIIEIDQKQRKSKFWHSEDEDNTFYVSACILTGELRKKCWDFARLFHALIMYINPFALAHLITNSSKQETGNEEFKYANLIRMQARKAATRQARINNTAYEIRINTSGYRRRIATLPKFQKKYTKTSRASKVFKERKRDIDINRVFNFHEIHIPAFNVNMNNYSESFFHLGGFSKDQVKQLQIIIDNFIGIDEHFDEVMIRVNADKIKSADHAEEVDKENEDESQIPAAFHLILSVCVKDIERDANDYYRRPWDSDMILDIYSWIIAYKRMYFYNYNMKKQKEMSLRKKNNMQITNTSEYKDASLKIELLDRSAMLLALQPYIAYKSPSTYLLKAVLQSSMGYEKKNNSWYRASKTALATLSQQLKTIHMHIHSKNKDVFDVCKVAVLQYFSENIINEIGWILKHFNSSVHEPEIFYHALDCTLILIQLLKFSGGKAHALKKKKKNR